MTHASPTMPSAPTPRETAARVGRRLSTTLVHRAAELRRSPPRRAEDPPSAVPELTTAWLTDALCRTAPGARVLGFDVTGSSSQTTSRAALRLRYDEAGRAAGLPEHVFVKLTATVRQRMFLGLIRCLEGEPLFYRDLRPLLDMECPLGYFGAVDRRSWRSAVVIEDVAATRGATFCHATTAVSRADIESLLDVMATYHGAMWESATVRGATWLKRPIDHFHNTSAFLNMCKRCAVGVHRAADVIPAAVREAPDALWRAFLDSMQRSSEGPLTLLHGDPHVGNTYRTEDTGMALSDWQVCMRGSWGFDYAYAVSTALTVADRRAWEHDLMARYLDRLERAGGHPPAFDEAMRIYRRSLMYPWHTWTTVIGRSAVQPRMQDDDVCRLIIERISHAIDDLDALAAFRR